MFAGVVLSLCWINLIEGVPVVCAGHTTLLECLLQVREGQIIQLMVELSPGADQLTPSQILLSLLPSK